MDNDHIIIQKIEQGTDGARKLLCYVQQFSWLEVKEHTVARIRAWSFEDWETPFAAVDGDKIVGMATIAKNDYYPLPEFFPWISTIFVSEAYRGGRISEKLIDFANRYAKENGFERTYIPTAIVGLYEKYGYRYLKDIVNYGGKIDRLYVKEL